MKYFIALFLIFTANLTYAQQQATFPPPCTSDWCIELEKAIEDAQQQPTSPASCTGDWWIEVEIEAMENVENLLSRDDCPEKQSSLEVAFETYFSELLFSPTDSTARNRLYSFLFGVVMGSDYHMDESDQSEYERYFDLFSHVVKLHAGQVLLR